MTIEDPIVLAKPYVHVPRTWTLAQSPTDIWTEYLCTGNEETSYMQNMDTRQREEILNRMNQPVQGRGGRGGQ
jgi:hypothetical protein